MNNGFLAEHGTALIENGYHILPIQPNSKRPFKGMDGWPELRATKADLTSWMKSGYGAGGVGIICKHTPAIDIDVPGSPELAQELEDYCVKLLGNALIRVGNYPKRLLLCRSDEPFAKMKSDVYKDEWGESAAVEILADGQYFVAYGIHPSTQAPYHWTTEDTPLRVRAEDLPLITKEKAELIIAKFEELASQSVDMELARSSRTSYKRKLDNGDDIDGDDPFANLVEPVSMSRAEITTRVMSLSVEQADDHQIWVNVGMALYHQFDGDAEGKELWAKWSEKSEKYDERVIEKRWQSFRVDGKNKNPITFRYVLDLSYKADNSELIKLSDEFAERFEWVSSIEEWEKCIDEVKEHDFDTLKLNHLVQCANTAHMRINKTKVEKKYLTIRMRFEKPIGDKPAWMNNWVYDSSDDKFFNTKNMSAMTITGFDMCHNELCMTQDDIAEGRATPKHRPSDLAGAVYKVTKVHSRQYQPLEGDIFERDGLTIANTYPANTVPERKFSLTVDDKRAIDLVKGHIAHLLDDERDQRLFTSWLSYVVSNPGHKVNWAVLLQGTEGDGKSFFSFLLRAVMGVPNVSMLNASSFQSNFTGWAVGQCVTAVEEIRLQGESRYDILNKIKPFITNPVIEVHAKGKTQFTADNTTNYILFTNFKDALPLNSNDRRYCVFFSKWQNREDLDAFVNTHPNYYRDLYRAIEMHPRAIRGWLMDYELDAEFEAKGNAPITKAHSEMVANSMSEVSKAILELVSDNNYPTIGQELIVLGDLNNAIIDSGMDPIAQVKWPRELSKLGYYGYPTRVKIDGSLLRIYVKDLAKFGNNCDGAWSADTYLISKYLTSLDKTCKIDPFEDDEL